MGGPLTSNGHSKHISFISGSEDLSTNIRSLEVDGISKKIRRFGKSVSKSTTQGRGLKPSTSLALTKPYESADTASLETNTDIQTNDCALSEYTGSALGRQSQEQHRKPTCFCSRLLRAVCQCVLGASMLVMFSMASVTFMAAIQHCYRMPVRSNLSMENFTLSRRNASHGVRQCPCLHAIRKEN
uniref:Uncharacterized protein n=1 Tax=Schistocephalus solidus TaxID=70667 RepID=A0A0X3NF78_SCHSO